MRPELSSYAHIASGKVRDIYEIDDNTLLMVVSDRISAYDHGPGARHSGQGPCAYGDLEVLLRRH